MGFCSANKLFLVERPVPGQRAHRGAAPPYPWACLTTAPGHAVQHRWSSLKGGGGGVGQGSIRRGGGGGEGVYQKWPDQIFPTVNFVFSHDGHFGLGGGVQGGGVTPPLLLQCTAILIVPTGYLFCLGGRRLWQCQGRASC